MVRSLQLSGEQYSLLQFIYICIKLPRPNISLRSNCQFYILYLVISENEKMKSQNPFPVSKYHLYHKQMKCCGHH